MIFEWEINKNEEKIKWKEHEMKKKFKISSVILGLEPPPPTPKSSLLNTTLSIESIEWCFYN